MKEPYSVYFLNTIALASAAFTGAYQALQLLLLTSSIVYTLIKSYKAFKRNEDT